MLALGACASKPLALPQGRSMVMATYSAGELETTLPEAARVQAVIAAADQTFAARAYSIRRLCPERTWWFVRCVGRC